MPSNSHLQPGQGAIKEMVTADDHSVQSALVIQQVAVEQTQVPANNNPLVPCMNNTLTKEQRDNMQREVIFNYLAGGLKLLIVNQRVSGASGLRGSLSTPSSLIKIDLSALGINSISISVNPPAQNNVINAVTAPHFSARRSPRKLSGFAKSARSSCCSIQKHHFHK